MNLTNYSSFGLTDKNANDHNILKKKTKRGNFSEKSTERNDTKSLNRNKKIFGIISSASSQKRTSGSKSEIRYQKEQKQYQINDYFEKPNNPQNMENSFNSVFLNNLDQSFSYSIFKCQKKIPRKKNHQKKLNKSDYINNNSSEYKSNYNDALKDCFYFFSNNQKSSNEINPNDQNYDNNNNIFDQSEINSAKMIQKEFTKEIENVPSKTDKLIKITIFFLNKGFTEHIRYHIYKSIINYGFPSTENFNTFHQQFIKDCSELKPNIAIPEKMLIEFYIEYISNFLISDKLTKAESEIISKFFFNNEDIEIIRSNILFIHTLKEKNSIKSFLQNYLGANFDKIFKNNDIKLNYDFPKTKGILIKILTNIVVECDKIGYTNYKKIITNDNIVFSGLEITHDNPKLVIHKRKMISEKIFGQELSDKKFSTVLIDYYLQLFSTFEY